MEWNRILLRWLIGKRFYRLGKDDQANIESFGPFRSFYAKYNPGISANDGPKRMRGSHLDDFSRRAETNRIFLGRSIARITANKIQFLFLVTTREKKKWKHQNFHPIALDFIWFRSVPFQRMFTSSQVREHDFVFHCGLDVECTIQYTTGSSGWITALCPNALLRYAGVQLFSGRPLFHTLQHTCLLPTAQSHRLCWIHMHYRFFLLLGPSMGANFRWYLWYYCVLMQLRYIRVHESLTQTQHYPFCCRCYHCFTLVFIVLLLYRIYYRDTWPIKKL